MPYSGPDDDNLPSNVQELTEQQRSKWVKTWNSTYKNCMSDSRGGGAGAAKNCETMAFRIANGTIKEAEMDNLEEHEELADEKQSLSANDKRNLLDTAVDRRYGSADRHVWVRDVWDDYLVYADRGQSYKVPYTIGADNAVTLGESVEVIVTTDVVEVKEGTSLWSALKDKIEDIWDYVSLKQVTKTEDGIQFRASDYAVVPDTEKPSTWKLRLAEGRSGNFTVAQVARAITAMQPGGYRGQRVELGSGDKAQAIKRISAAIGKTGGTDDQKENLQRRLARVKEAPLSSFSVTKDKLGNMRWIGLPTNKWRDRDNPPQIIEEKAHLEFVEHLDETKNFPVLLTSHIPGTRIGVADWVDYSDGFLVMGGSIDKDRYNVAERLAEECRAENIGMSHGFVYSFSDAEKQIIGKYRMWEVSHLPLAEAANVWTSIDILRKEIEMPIRADKRERAVALHGEEVIARIEAQMTEMEKSNLSAGIDFKDFEEVKVEETPQIDGDELTEKAVKAIVESEGFKQLITGMATMATQVKELTETTIPGLTKKVEAVEAEVKQADEKAGKSQDEIIAGAFSTPAAKGHQASKVGQELTEEEKKQAEETQVNTPIDEGFLTGMGMGPPAS